MRQMKRKDLQQYSHAGSGNCSPLQKIIFLISILCFITSCNNEYVEDLNHSNKSISNEAIESIIENTSSTRANQAPGGFLVNIIWTPDLKRFNDILGVPYQTGLNYLESLADGYSNIHRQPIQVNYYAVEHFGIVRIGLITYNSYVASEMFIREFLRDFTSLMIQASTFGITFDFEFYVDYPEWSPVTGDTITR